MRRIQWLGILLLIIIFFLLGIYAGAMSGSGRMEASSPPADPPAEEERTGSGGKSAVPDIRTATIVSAGAVIPTRRSSTRPTSVTVNMILPPALK